MMVYLGMLENKTVTTMTHYSQPNHMQCYLLTHFVLLLYVWSSFLGCVIYRQVDMLLFLLALILIHNFQIGGR